MKGLLRSLARSHKVPVTRTIKASSLALEVDGASGVGFGSAVLADFPQGNIRVIGAVANMQFTGPTSGSLADTWQGDFAIGSTPASDGTLTGADVDIVASTALAAATAEVSPKTRGTGSGVLLDNTDGSLEMNISLLVDDANISADDLDFTVDGELYISYQVLGDD